MLKVFVSMFIVVQTLKRLVLFLKLITKIDVIIDPVVVDRGRTKKVVIIKTTRNFSVHVKNRLVNI